jgi:hypothetical protein
VAGVGGRWLVGEGDEHAGGFHWGLIASAKFKLPTANWNWDAVQITSEFQLFTLSLYHINFGIHAWSSKCM